MGEAEKPRLLIVGCSTRAAAWSAVRAGFQPICADQFADADLQQIADVLPLIDYPQGLPAAVSHVSSDAWMFVGALENRPDVLSEIARNAPGIGPLISSAPEKLPQLRDPQRLQECAAAAGLPTVGTRSSPPVTVSSSTSTGDWLMKPRRSGGGIGVQAWESPNTPLRSSDAEWYWQQFIPGTPGAFVGYATERGVISLGWTLQWRNEPVAALSEPYLYCGGLGPINVPQETTSRVVQAATRLFSDTGFRGPFSIDVILAKDGVYLIECNPRYPASCELLELASHRSALAQFESNRPRRPGWVSTSTSRQVGKLILYARHEVRAPDLSWFLRPRSPWSVPWIADIPQSGTVIPAGAPMCTVFATGLEPLSVLNRLRRRAERVRRWFGEAR